MIDYWKVAGGIVALGTIMTSIWTFAIAVSDYRKKIDNIDELASRISKVESKLSGSDKIVSVEGPRGADGVPGRQGDPGLRGPQGEKGEKGEPGISPTQLSNLESRISAIERRTSNNSVPSGTTPTSLPPISPQSRKMAGIGINAKGCYFLTPDFQSASIDLAEGDRFCTIDGEASMTISEIVDDRFYFSAAGGRENECTIQANRPTSWCGRAPFNNNVYMAGRAIKFDQSGKRRVSIEFLMR